ncbi:MAG: Ig-like domain-containing protein, partial [Myxococcota bacterium]
MKFVLKTPMLCIAVATTLAACAIGELPGSESCASDSTAPTVRAEPASPISAPEGTRQLDFMLLFEESVTGVDPSALSIDNGASIAQVRGDGGSYTVTASGLADDQVYTVTLAADDVADSCGNPLASDFTVRIGVGAAACAVDDQAPVLVSSAPTTKSFGFGTTQATVTLRFSEPVVNLGNSLRIDNGATVASVTPMGVNYELVLTDLAGGTTTLSVDDSLQDSCGNTLGAPETIELFVEPDTGAPRVQSTTPADQATEVPRDTALTVTFSEPVVPSSGTIEATVNAAPTQTSVAWDGTNTVATLTLGSALGFEDVVLVTVQGYEDGAGNTQSMPFEFTFTTLGDPCAGSPQASTLSQTSEMLTLDSSGRATVTVSLTEDFALREDQLTLTPTSGGAAALVPGSLAGAGSTWTMELAGAALEQTYDLEVGMATSADGCTDFLPATMSLRIGRDLPTSSGACPLPPVLARHVAAPVGCDMPNVHDRVSRSFDTRQTLSAPGEAFSLSGVFDTDNQGASSDEEHFRFSVTETGNTLTTLRVTLAYGCAFTGTGIPSAGSFRVDIQDTTASPIGVITGPDTYEELDGSGSYGAISRTVDFVGPAGTNDYIINTDDITGSSFCFDYVVYVEYADNARPSSCEGQALSVRADASPQQAYLNPATGQAFASVPFDGPYQLRAQDLTLTATSGGAGALAPSSIFNVGDTYYVALSGVNVGETYNLEVMGDQMMCTSVSGGALPVTISERFDTLEACPLPGPAANNYTSTASTCSAHANTSLATSEATG